MTLLDIGIFLLFFVYVFKSEMKVKKKIVSQPSCQLYIYIYIYVSREGKTIGAIWFLPQHILYVDL